MWQEITDREQVLALHDAGLLWDSCRGLVPSLDGEPQEVLRGGRWYHNEWDGPHRSHWDTDYNDNWRQEMRYCVGAPDWKFYILLEE